MNMHAMDAIILAALMLIFLKLYEVEKRLKKLKGDFECLVRFHGDFDVLIRQWELEKELERKREISK